MSSLLRTRAASGTGTQRKTYCSQIPSTRTWSPNPYSRPVGEEPIDWPALHQQAGDLLQSATADAEAILSEAHTNCAPLSKVRERVPPRCPNKRAPKVMTRAIITESQKPRARWKRCSPRCAG